ncbi:Uma2 family endonuclease [Alienimonas californiensis]|uniref:Putative restriction endonuclease domain-containing protein n=1 Tax=Alienimonas californiensis TaxID=2527989 RepID=A0A517P742_9PLAN|nr:Uma2 family endonuclease [Alienimonas californiensis]QDT15208.1 hypothetical protein CA12_12900 [Alienimonas californiensis]
MSTAAPPVLAPPPRGAAPAADGLMTHVEFWHYANRPENADRNLELVDGKVVEMSRPHKLHGVLLALISNLLNDYAKRAGFGQVAGGDSGVLIARDPDVVRGPDVCFYAEKTSYADLLADYDTPGYDDVLPVLIVEVLSASDRHADVVRKVTGYLEAGVKLVWVVDPPAREVTIYRPDAPPAFAAGDAPLPASDALPGFQCRAADLFPAE